METIRKNPKVSINLNLVIEYILDNLNEERPEFIKICDRKINTELHAYTERIMSHTEMSKVNETTETAKANEVNKAMEASRMNVISKVTRPSRLSDFNTSFSEKVIETIENKSGKLLDSICMANNAYLEEGIRIGANLLWQLLGL